ncbi:DNA translocase FtsK 4TM domain-containing protein [Oceanospirillum maris]|uniref:DNA translocase FtsK 4TM domain-containing protein n=1 Tax=Oceanospirillum maris TaxID=64977 RepID=UPI000406CA6E|nr:DNA translocase FtsK 4TM domain-containing protein [Oceanospirillum maris]
MTTDEQPSSNKPFETDHLLADRIRNGAREWVVILVLGLCSLIVLALASFDPNDGGWSSSRSQGMPENLLGRFGAYFSDLLLSFLGYSAYMIPMVMLYYAFHRIFFRGEREELVGPQEEWQEEQNTEQQEIGGSALGLRGLGFVVWVCANATLASLHFFQPDSLLPSGPGGVVGEAFTSLFQYNLGLMGATLIMLGLWMIGFSLLTGWSWLLIIDTLGFHAETSTIKVFEWLRQEARDSSAGLPEQFSAPDTSQVYRRKISEQFGNGDGLGNSAESSELKNKPESISEKNDLENQDDAFFTPSSFTTTPLTPAPSMAPFTPVLMPDSFPQEEIDTESQDGHQGDSQDNSPSLQADANEHGQADIHDNDPAVFYDEPQEQEHWFQRLKNQLPLLPPIFSLKEPYKTPRPSSERISERIEPEISFPSAFIPVDEPESEPHLGFSEDRAKAESLSDKTERAPETIESLEMENPEIERDEMESSEIKDSEVKGWEIKTSETKSIDKNINQDIENESPHDLPEDTASTLNGWGESGVSEEGGISFESLGKSPDLNRHS